MPNECFFKRPLAKVGNIVMIIDENRLRHTCRKDIITEVTKPKEGQARRVTVKTTTGILENLTTKVAILDAGKELQAEEGMLPFLVSLNISITDWKYR